MESAYKYCVWCTRKNNKKVPKYVKLQAKAWKKIADGKDRYAYVSSDRVELVDAALKLMIHPDLNEPIAECGERYALFFIYAVFCTLSKKSNKRYYTTALLEIARKNFKTFYSAVIFILGMITEPKFSRFFSVAPDKSLSKELQIAIKKIIKSSPALIKYFDIKRDEIEFKLNDIIYTPLAYSHDKMDGKLPTMFLADEAGCLDTYPIEAMRSGQVTLKDKLGIIVSTQYPNDKNVFTEEIDISKKVLDKLCDERYFALLYEPDEELRKHWQEDDYCIYQSNPAAVDNKEIFTEIVRKRTMAVLYESRRENYLCKHNNIFYRSVGVESFVDINDLRMCCEKTEKSFWKGKRVYIGLDLSLSEDNTAVMFACMNEGKLYAGGMCFIPYDSVEIKSEREKLDYKARIAAGECIACGDRIIDYGTVEEYILGLEKEYGFKIVKIGFDKYNAISTVQKLERAHYRCVEIGQHSKFLHSPTKFLKEMILKGMFRYNPNRMLEINFENARCIEDTNLNKYINKKKSSGKVDMVAALVNAVFLIEQEGKKTEFFVFS